MRLRVLVVDDHDALRKAVVDLLNRDDETSVVAEASNARDAVRRARLVQPDVIVMDARLPDADEIEVLRRIRQAAGDARIVTMSLLDVGAVRDRLLRAGADAFVVKDEHLDRLPEVIRRVTDTGNGRPRRESRERTRG